MTPAALDAVDPAEIDTVDPAELNAMDPAELEVFQAFQRVLHLNRLLMIRVLGAEGAHPGQVACLRVLERHDGIAQRELADLLQVSPPTITTMLQRMERAGMVARHVDAADQRLTRVHLTPEGRRLEVGLRGVLAENIHRILGPMSVEDRRELARLLRIMADNTRRALE